MHRFFCSDIPETGSPALLDAREAEHLFKVFRAREGDEIELLDGHGVRAGGVVGAGKTVTVTWRETIPEPEEKLHLCCALPRKQKLDQLLKQAAELGVWSIRPVKCMRSVAEGGPRERWDLLLREACKQSGNPFLPEVEPEEKLPDVLEKLQQQNIKIYYGSVTPAGSGGGFAREKAVLIGPEGGFAPEEIKMMEKCNAQPLNLGPYVLRLETAAICALSVLRKLSVLAVLALTVLITGCSCDDSSAMINKGQSLLEAGDATGAQECFRMAIAENPQDPNAYLALGQLCSENLSEPLEAIYAYKMYLKLTDGVEGVGNREEIEAKIQDLQVKAVESFGIDNGTSEADAEKIRTLESKVASLERVARAENQSAENLRKKYGKNK